MHDFQERVINILSPERDVERCVRIMEEPSVDIILFTDQGDYDSNYALCFAYIHIPQIGS